MSAACNSRKLVLVIGAGFAGLSAVQHLKGAPVNIIVLDQANHHLFQPLLYQVATAGLSAADIALPIRHILKHQKNVTVLMEKVISVDKIRLVVTTDSGNQYSYDYLIIATGARHSYFGHEDWLDYAPGLKCLKEALSIREKILAAFEKAEATQDLSLRTQYLTFVIIGAGPTGVEMAGAIRELATESLKNEYQHINPACATVILIEANSRILSGFPEKLAHLAEKKLYTLGVQVYTDEKVVHIDGHGVQTLCHAIKAHTIIWAAGVKATEAATWLNVASDKSGRILVKPDLSIPDYPHIFAIGDVSACLDKHRDSYLPGLAAVAKQQGAYVGRLISKKIAGLPCSPFSYRDYGNLATIGRKYAIADFKKIQLDGAFAYVLWWIVHIYFLIGFRNRFIVLVNWLWSYITLQRSARLIIHQSQSLTMHDES